MVKKLINSLEILLEVLKRIQFQLKTELSLAFNQILKLTLTAVHFPHILRL